SCPTRPRPIRSIASSPPQNKGRPRWDAPSINRRAALGRLLLLDRLAVAIAGVLDRDGARLHGFWNLAAQRNVEQPVVQLRTLDLHIVGKLEAALEGTLGDALMQELASGLLLVGLLASDGEDVLLYFDVDVVG